jgi:hypothetical protein
MEGAIKNGQSTKSEMTSKQNKICSTLETPAPLTPEEKTIDL